MKTSNNHVKRLTDNIITGGIEKDDVEIMLKVRMINLMSIIAILILVPLGIVDLIRGSSTIGIFVLVIAAVIIFNQFYLRKSGDYVFPIYCGISLVAAYFFYALITGGVNNTGYLWYFTFPLFTLFLLGAKRGALVTLLLLFISILFFTMNPSSSRFTVYSTDLKIRFVASYLVIFLFSYLFETLREKAQQKLSLKNVELEDTIAELKESEEKLQKAHEELERRVEERTADLVKVNDQLEKEIKERRQAGEALRESEDRYRVLVEESPFGVSLVGKDGRCKYLNPTFTEIFGYGLEDISTGREWFQKAYPDQKYREKVISSWTSDLRDAVPGEPRPCTYTVTCKDGSEKIIHFRPVTMETGDQFVIYEDITERTQLEAQLQLAQRMEALGTLAGGIAHNFNNLLTGIMGNTSLILIDTDPTHPHYKRLKSIEKLVDSGSNLTRQLLGYARKGQYEVRALNVNLLMKEIADTFALTKKDISVHQELESNLHGIHADQGQIEQILWNLYVNAADAMPAGGELFLRTTNVTDKDIKDKPYKVKPGTYILLTVRDTGVGMDRKTTERIFEPFFTTKGLAKGTGLGLASVYGIVKAHGGYIDVDSKKGKGTTFSIYLPALKKQGPENKVTPETIERGKEMLMLVDDEAMILEVGQEMLEMLGYTVIQAKGGEKALTLYKKHKDVVELVILDMVMPGMGGGETYDQLKEINPEVRVLLSSGYSIDGQAKEILERGCDGFIQKPFNMKQLSQKIREILDKEHS